MRTSSRAPLSPGRVLLMRLTLAALLFSTLVSSTRIVHEEILGVTTITADGGACEHFRGACIANGAGSTAPTTPLNNSPPPTPSFSAPFANSRTSTYIPETHSPIPLPATTSCAPLDRACVIYETDEKDDTVYATTVYNNDSNLDEKLSERSATRTPGAGAGAGNHMGYIGAATGDIDMWTLAPWISLLVLNVGFVVFM